MKIAASNIGWAADRDEQMYVHMAGMGFSGLEIAPTRLYPDQPYQHTPEAAAFALELQARYGLVVCSMQSIWFGRNERMFESEVQRQALLLYTFQAIQFAQAMRCGNLVFGCPRNRQTMCDGDLAAAVDFFREVARFAYAHDTCVAIEPNPPIYNTNFINTTREALELVRDVSEPGFKINADLGAMLYYGESVQTVVDELHLVNHIHVSEPGLAPLECHALHREMAGALRGAGYDRFLSIEMAKCEEIGLLLRAMDEVVEVFG